MKLKFLIFFLSMVGLLPSLIAQSDSIITKDSGMRNIALPKDSAKVMDTALVRKQVQAPVEYKYNGAQLKHETALLFKRPLSWKAKDWLTLALIGGGTYLLMQNDNAIRNYALDQHVRSKDNPP